MRTNQAKSLSKYILIFLSVISISWGLTSYGEALAIGLPGDYAAQCWTHGGSRPDEGPCGNDGNQIPVINVNNPQVELSAGTLINMQMVRAGVSATDAEDGDLTAQIIVNGPSLPLTAQSGHSYVFTFDVQDSQGAPAVQKSKTFSVPFNQAPSINVTEPNINISAGTQIDLTLVLNGVTASDPEDGDITNNIQVSGPALPLTAMAGQVYNFTFNVQDSMGLPADPKFKSFQVDSVNTPPVIDVNGEEILVQIGEVITEADVRNNVTAMDAEDGDLTSSIVISGPNLPLTVQAGQTYHFTYNVTDSGGLPATPKARDFNVAQNQIILISPPNGQMGTSRQALLTWDTLFPVAPNTTFTWKITPNANCAGSQSDLTGNVQGKEYQIPSYYQLSAFTTYYWCVKSDQLGLSYTAPFHFTTQKEQIPTLFLSVLPLTSANEPSGQEDIIIRATNGEAGSVAYFYEIIGDQYVEIGSQMANNYGDIEFSFHIDNVSGPKEFKFAARLKRGNEFGNYSNPSSYFFDPALTVPSVELKHYEPVTKAKMRWLPNPEAASYKVWRRVGEELCNETLQDCYLGTKPYELIASIDAASADMENGHIVFTDPNYRTTAPHGTSYFVTTINAKGQSSKRSNSISFEDNFTPQNIPSQDNYHSIARTDGYNIDVFICDTSHAYQWDNSADMKVIVQYAERQIDETCDDFDYDSRAVSVQNVFDSLERRNFSEYGLQSCALANTHVGLPGRSYCERVCLEDMSSNRKICSDGQSINTPNDETAPGFDGITNVIPQDDGFSALVKWKKALPSAEIETIQYEVKYTKETDASGLPIFSGTSFIVENVHQTSAIINNLETGTRYFFEVNAIDTAGNRSGQGHYLDRMTLDNRPKIHHMIFDQVPNPHRPEQKRLVLQVIDREAPMGDRVALKKVEYLRPGETEWREFNLQNDLILNQAQINSLYAASTPGESNETEFVLDSRNHFIKLSSGKIRVTVEDQHGLEGQKELDVALLRGASDYANFSASANAAFGCSSRPDASNSPWSSLLSFILIVGVCALLRRRLCQN